MHATPEATARYAARHPEYQAAGFYRTALGLTVSTLGIDTYPGDAGEGGINFLDSAINYRNQHSEHTIGAALARLQESTSSTSSASTIRKRSSAYLRFYQR